MATVTRNSAGYEFSGPSSVGKQLVNGFQREHSLLCEPSPDPDFRFIRFGTPEENCLLEKLVADVRAREPGITRSPSQFKRHVAKS